MPERTGGVVVAAAAALVGAIGRRRMVSARGVMVRGSRAVALTLAYSVDVSVSSRWRGEWWFAVAVAVWLAWRVALR